MDKMDNTFVRLYWFLFSALSTKEGRWAIRFTIPENVPQYLCITLECTYDNKIHRYPKYIRLDALRKLTVDIIFGSLYTDIDFVAKQGEQDA